MSEQRRAGARRAALGAVLALGLGLGMVPALDVATAPRATAAPGDSGSTAGVPSRATSGNGAHRARIGWVSWGANGDTVTNRTVVNWHEVGPAQRAEVTCTLSNVPTGALRVSTPGSYAGDGLDHLYGGLPTGLINIADGAEIGFDVACSAELVAYDGNGWATTNVTGRRSMPLGGLVFADAESTGGNEFVQATATNGSTTNSPWRVIDGHDGGCASRNNRIEASVSRNGSTWTARLANSGSECTSGTGTPSAVLLADGVNSLAVRVKGYGYTAAAVGYAFGVDYGDAPASFGAAGGMVLPTWSGAQLATGTTNVAGYTRANNAVSMTYAVAGPPTVSLGANAAANATVPYSANAAADTPDEDAFTGLTVPAPTLYVPTTAPYTAIVKCRGTGTSRVAGWIDWNRNNRFDPGERSDVASCTNTTAGGGNVTLSWIVPADAAFGASFLRLRVSTDITDLDNPVGVSLQGEVEDWSVTVGVARLEVTKTADVAEVPAAGGVVSYTVTVRNTGNVPFTAARPAYLVDDVAAAADDADLGARTVSPTGGTLGLEGTTRITWTGPLAAGAAVALRYPMTVKAAPGDRVMTNLARVSAASTGVTPPITCDPGSADLAARVCARLQLWALGVDVVKTAHVPGTGAPIASGAVLAPATPVQWRYTVTNTGSAPLVDVRLSDAWDENRTTVSGNVASSGDVVISCPGLPPAATVVIPRLEPAAAITCTGQREVVPHP